MSMLLLFALAVVCLSAVALKVAPPKVVLVTGCSSGIGRSIALEFAKSPQYKVWATMRSVDKWMEEPKDNIIVAPLDVTSQDSVDSLISDLIQKEGRVDILVNNAGIGIAGCLETVSIDEAKALFDINVWGVVRMLQAVLPHMRKKKNGYIINISSTSGIRGIPCMEYYTGSKFALEGITDSMRYSLAPYNISVTNVNAGPVRTKFTDKFGKSESGGKGTREVPEDDVGYLEAMTDRLVNSLNRRMESPEAQTSEDVARVVVNLAYLKQEAKKITDVPFNMGTSMDSQAVIEATRKHPTGWGGIFTSLLGSVPAIPKGDHNEL